MPGRRPAQQSPGRRPAQQSDVREDLVAAAEHLLMDAGLAGATSRKIALAAGTTVASVNYHFGSKDGLISVVVGNHMVPLMENLVGALKEGSTIDPDRPVESILHQYAETFLINCLEDPILREAMGVLYSNPQLADRWNRENIYPFTEPLVDLLHEHMPGLSHAEVRRRFQLFYESVSGQTINRMNAQTKDDAREKLDAFIAFITPAFLAD